MVGEGLCNKANLFIGFTQSYSYYIVFIVVGLTSDKFLRPTEIYGRNR